MMKKSIVWLLIILGFLTGALALILTIYDFTLSKTVCNSYHSVFTIETNKIDAKVGYGTLVKGKLTNTGGDDEYKIDTTQGWIVVRPNNFRLKTNESVDLYIYISPINKGSFDTYINAYSFCHSNTQRIEVNSN
ncbi:MAG: hypothetical protein N3D75_01040 [Candidatus Aenigmarchaeota archaeon]|nr:hypothetical protein [Candidatus Aenigmarchaeota archaeon]